MVRKTSKHLITIDVYAGSGATMKLLGTYYVRTIPRIHEELMLEGNYSGTVHRVMHSINRQVPGRIAIYIR